MTSAENQAAIQAILDQLDSALATQRAADTEESKPIPGTYTVGNGVYEVRADGTAEFVKPAKAKATVEVLDEVPASVCRVAAKVTSIRDKAFTKRAVRKALKKVKIGANVQVIGKNAFTNCAKLTSVTGGANVTTIGENAFSGCTALKKFTFGEKLTNIGKKAFYKCPKLKTLVFKGTGNLTVGKGAVAGIHPKAKVKVPKAVEKTYRKVLRNKGKLPAGAKVNGK